MATPRLKPCDCNDWKEGMKQIEAAQFLQWNHGGKYTAPPFRYCPWCGKKRVAMLEITLSSKVVDAA